MCPCARHKQVEGTEVWLHSYSTSALDGGERLTSRPDRFTPSKNTLFPLNGRGWGSESHRRYGRCEKEKNLLHVPGFESRTAQLRGLLVIPSQNRTGGTEKKQEDIRITASRLSFESRISKIQA
jgi:hypothetical protein